MKNYKIKTDYGKVRLWKTQWYGKKKPENGENL